MKRAVIRPMYAADDVAADLEEEFLVYVAIDPDLDPEKNDIVVTVALSKEDAAARAEHRGYRVVDLDDVYECVNTRWRMMPGLRSGDVPPVCRACGNDAWDGSSGIDVCTQCGREDTAS